VSKLFTWTAIMQLVEEGRLDLDVDVNRWLDFKIPATYAKPITLRHVMTQASGFEEDSRDILASDPTQAGPIGSWLATHMLAHLDDGAMRAQRILRATTAEQMHARTFVHEPRSPGFALEFYEQSSHGLRIIGHGGNTQWFHSNLTLIPHPARS
jgi:CubicO group peptidase (beta-lactamase class C family)